MTDTVPNYFLSKQSLEETQQRKTKEWSRNNVYNICGQHNKKGFKGGGIMVDLKLLEQKRTSAVVYSEIKSRVRKDKKKKKATNSKEATIQKRNIWTQGHSREEGTSRCRWLAAHLGGLVNNCWLQCLH